MPSRKSGSSETTQPESRRGSLRRLSSIASFHSIQTLFNRRQSNQQSNLAASSSSNLSLTSSTIANAPQPRTQFAASTNNLSHESRAAAEVARPPPVQHNARKSSYICLPDDPIGGMPRSRTFSNLPLPSRTKKSTTNVASSKSYARLPTAILPSTRLRPPSVSVPGPNKFHTRLPSTAEARGPLLRNRMERSDTEPTLQASLDQASNIPRPTAFKENISLSPIKPLPATDVFGKRETIPVSVPSQWYGRQYGMSDSSEASDHVASSEVSSSPTLSKHALHPAMQLAQEHKSSPAYRSGREPLKAIDVSKPEPVQRWNSQPILTNNTNLRRNSQHCEIKQTRLMSARQAPTPPAPKTPLSSHALTAGQVKSLNNSAPIREVSEQTPTRSATRKDPSPPKRKIHGVIDHEEPAYWAGRLSSLVDHYRNEDLAAHLSNPPIANPKSKTDGLHTAEATTTRLLRAFECLGTMCVTPEARNSLIAFRAQYAVQIKCPELGRPMAMDASGGKGDAEGGSYSVDIQSGGYLASEGRKISFMDRLLGRPKRRSLVLA